MPGNINRQEGARVNYLDRHSWNTLIEKYRQASGRLLLLNYDGTLTPFFNQPSLAAPDNLLLEILENISGNEKNAVYIISGRDPESLENWLGHLPLGLVAGHGADGAWLRHKGGSWEKNDDKSPAIRKILALEKGDFILAAGDDMFPLPAGMENAYTIKVGPDASSAKYNLHSPAMVLSLLKNMILLDKQGGK